MSSQEALDYLESQLNEQIAGFEASRKFYRSAQFYLTLATATLSGLATVLVGMGKYIDRDWWFILPLACSASVAVAAAYEGFLCQSAFNRDP